MSVLKKDDQIKISLQKLKHLGIKVENKGGDYEIKMGDGRVYRPNTDELIRFERKLSKKKGE